MLSKVCSANSSAKGRLHTRASSVSSCSLLTSQLDGVGAEKDAGQKSVFRVGRGDEVAFWALLPFIVTRRSAW